MRGSIRLCHMHINIASCFLKILYSDDEALRLLRNGKETWHGFVYEWICQLNVLLKTQPEFVSVSALWSLSTMIGKD